MELKKLSIFFWIQENQKYFPKFFPVFRLYLLIL